MNKKCGLPIESIKNIKMWRELLNLFSFTFLNKKKFLRARFLSETYKTRINYANAN
jgi:hypothetical protein